MPLSTAKPIMDQAMKKAFSKLDPKRMNGKQDQSKILESIAAEISSAVDAYVKQAMVAPGIPVVAPPPTGIGATTGPGTLI